MLIPLPAPPAVRKIIDFQHEINLFSQYVTSPSNASVLTMNVFHPMDHPLFCQFKCSLTWAKEIKAVTPLRLSDRKQKAPLQLQGYTKECTEYDVSPIPMSSSKDWETIQPHIVQQQYCQNLGFHQHTTESQPKLLLLFMMFC